MRRGYCFSCGRLRMLDGGFCRSCASDMRTRAESRRRRKHVGHADDGREPEVR